MNHYILALTNGIISLHRLHEKHLRDKKFPKPDAPEFPEAVQRVIYYAHAKLWDGFEIGTVTSSLERNQIDPGNHRACRTASTQGDMLENVRQLASFALGVVIRDRFTGVSEPYDPATASKMISLPELLAREPEDEEKKKPNAAAKQADAAAA